MSVNANIFDLDCPSEHTNSICLPVHPPTTISFVDDAYTNKDQVTILPSKVFHLSNGIHQAFPDSQTHWAAFSVLEWLESLASAAETSGASPILVNGTRLSEPSFPPIPTLSNDPTTPRWTHGEPQLVMTKNNRFMDMQQRDPAGWWGLRQLEDAASLVEDIGRLESEYHAIYERFEYTFNCILLQAETCGFEGRHLLDTLYKDTTRKLCDLLNTSASHVGLIAGGIPKVISAEGSAKKNFPRIMTAWLVSNWTNPYPDEEGLAELAFATDTSATVVGNWLINARTRKWRPAIVKASKHMDRPASLLLEDSINIFSNCPLRTLGDETTSSSTECSEFDSGHMLSIADAYSMPNKRLKSDYFGNM
ncbi:hypothetical protein MPSEU_000539800 [Mayamaea pseudoterrestris]|nr:hypothetical protein MPSEU_000539800 [Mayamaea pseudoterrestris]